ncbi:diacylglycerol kinase family protein [Amycolatopsis carbonis]|uniref:Diacylglycerol kinase family protein n=1 Tax=Amycolatopsis carbonis TaxID=715471 RepID=A0A9Y2MVL0_9PSEU|nr:diacylglycerol kinase family protein [Amycolatopsis sp. 2-15]WIX76842.1 diacylglycerol kinase family protein [Amycolatopsis sp. 2-15]
MDVRPTWAQVWLARSAFGAAFAAVAVLVGFAGLRSLSMLIVGVVGVCVFVAAVYWFLAKRGVVRWAAAVVAVAAPIAVLVLYIGAQLLWVALLSLALAALAAIAGRAALSVNAGGHGMPTYPALPVKHPFLLMNPRSGGGKVTKFGLKEKATAMGAEVALLDGPDIVDVAALARDAVARGADLLGVAGGDGTQALVAGIAAEHDLPFLVISAGTRNHFALDLGLDRDDPAKCLAGLTDGLELRVDLGVISGRTFVNNASFGAYAEIVQSPAYRNDKAGTTLKMLPDLIAGHRGPRLVVHAAGDTVDGPQAMLVSSGPYETGDVAGLGRRARLDYGVLGIIVVSVATAGQAVGLLRRNHRRGLALLTADEVVVEADEAEIAVGVDGEALMLPTPVRCTTRPKALRVRVPRNRPGVPPPTPAIDWVRLRRLAVGRG